MEELEQELKQQNFDSTPSFSPSSPAGSSLLRGALAKTQEVLAHAVALRWPALLVGQSGECQIHMRIYSLLSINKKSIYIYNNFIYNIFLNII